MKKTIAVFSALLFSLSVAFSDEIVFTAEKMSGSTGESSQYSKLSGNAFIKTKSMEIKADEIILSGKDFRFITATGKVGGKSSESKFDFSCEQMDFDRETEIVMLKGNVTLFDEENDVKASAQLIEFNQKTEVAIMQIDVKLLQKKNTCTGANAVYKKKEQTLELTGTPQIIKDQDTFKANEIFMNLETEEITLGGKVRGSVTQESKEEENEEVKAEEKNEEKAETTAGENSLKETEASQQSADEKGADEKTAADATKKDAATDTSKKDAVTDTANSSSDGAKQEKKTETKKSE